MQWPLRATTRSTTYLASIPGGTRVTKCVEKPAGRHALHGVAVAVFYRFLRRNVAHDNASSLDRLVELVERDLARSTPS